MIEKKQGLFTGISIGLIVLLGALVYANSFKGQLLLDDSPSILMNSDIRSGWSLLSVLKSSPRPLLYLTFAINYSLGQLNVFGYHLFNFLIHLAAALALFGVIRRTFDSPLLKPFPPIRALGLALVSTLLWVAHPLQTGSVTYVFQRSEALMGMFFLLTLYAAIRFFGGGEYAKFWATLSVVACFLGMTCKPVMVTAPLTVLFYDRIFWSRSWRALAQKRKKFYWALAASWILLIYLVSNPQESLGTVGWGVPGMSAGLYAINQPTVILHYLRLIFWPYPLILDYSWEPVRHVVALLPSINILLVLLAVTAWALRRKPALGFLGLWFFVILAPSSSFIPLADLAFEHRLYLPMAGIIILAVVGADVLLRRIFKNTEERILQGMIVFVIVLGILSYLTVRRNNLFQDLVAFWTEGVQLRPDNARVRYNLGLAYLQKGDKPRALEYYEQAAALRPDYEKAHNNLGNLYYEQGNKAMAVAHYRAALAIYPLYAEAHNNYGVVLMEAKNYREAEWHLKEALRINPDSIETMRNLGNLYYFSGDKKRAEDQYLLVLRKQPNSVEARFSLAMVYSDEGKLAEAKKQYEDILLFFPNDPVVHNSLGVVLQKQGDIPGAIFHFQEAIKVRPDYQEARLNLQLAQMQKSSKDEFRLRPVWPLPKESSETKPAKTPKKKK